MSWRARALLAWVAPRGIVAAAVGSVFAVSLEGAGVADADKLVPLVFAVIIATVVVQSLTAGTLARWLKVQQPEPNLVLIIGANHLARVIGQALKEQDIPVLLADPAWDYYRQARMAGLTSYYGNPQSEQAEQQLPLGSVRWVLALSPNRHQNALGVLVITSYSIHYTKLYEFWCRLGDRASTQRTEPSGSCCSACSDWGLP